MKNPSILWVTLLLVASSAASAQQFQAADEVDIPNNSHQVRVEKISTRQYAIGVVGFAWDTPWHASPDVYGHNRSSLDKDKELPCLKEAAKASIAVLSEKKYADFLKSVEARKKFQYHIYGPGDARVLKSAKADQFGLTIEKIIPGLEGIPSYNQLSIRIVKTPAGCFYAKPEQIRVTLDKWIADRKAQVQTERSFVEELEHADSAAKDTK